MLSSLLMLGPTSRTLIRPAPTIAKEPISRRNFLKASGAVAVGATFANALGCNGASTKANQAYTDYSYTTEYTPEKYEKALEMIFPDGVDSSELILEMSEDIKDITDGKIGPTKLKTQERKDLLVGLMKDYNLKPEEANIIWNGSAEDVLLLDIPKFRSNPNLFRESFMNNVLVEYLTQEQLVELSL